MTIFKSKQVNTDPAPWRDGMTGRRFASIAQADAEIHDISELEFDPRPEFNVTRDKRPWDASRSRPSSLGQIREWRRFASRAEGEGWGQIVEFDPRPEYDHPVNRILVAFREDVKQPGESLLATAEWYLLDLPQSRNTPDEIDHARRVLTRLANMKESSNG